MKKNSVFSIMALMMVFVLILTGCGGDAPAETTAAATETASAVPALGLESWTLSATTWSSPNGATIHINAIPYGYIDGRAAAFVVRLEGEEVASAACKWDGEAFTASLDLNAADGLCYYVIMADADGGSAEIPVNTPTMVADAALINLADALNAYCNLLVEESSFDGGKLKITKGTAQLQLPKISSNGESVICASAALILTQEGQVVATQDITFANEESAELLEIDLSGVSFKLSDLEEDQQLTLRLEVTLSNGQFLSDSGSNSFLYGNDTLLPVVG